MWGDTEIAAATEIVAQKGGARRVIVALTRRPRRDRYEDACASSSAHT